jgi:hypothetical protein
VRYLDDAWSGFVPAIHIFAQEGVDARHKAGHDK